MSLTLITVLALAMGLLAGVVAWQRRHPGLRRRCLVSLVSDERHTVSGVLWAVRGPWLVFRDCAVLEGTTRTPMDGEVLIDRRNIALMQAPYGGEQLR